MPGVLGWHKHFRRRLPRQVMGMKTSTLFLGVIGAALLTGCASRPTPVPVIGPRSGLNALVGEWSGEYSSPETGRSGNISFTLSAGKDTAFGNIIMVSRPQNEPVATATPADRPNVRTSAATAPGELLTIRFVRLEGGRVVGRLDPYRDPDCGCQLNTTFSGEFSDARTISGTFHSTGSGIGHMPASGRWKVTRVVP